MQRLGKDGLVERAGGRQSNRQREFRLTRTGQYVASVIDKYLPPPTERALREKIERRFQLKADRLRGVWDHSGATTYPLAPTHRSILQVIVSEKKIGTQLIPEKMEVKFTNPRSINLAVKTLEERGYIVRVGRASRNGVLWQVTAQGLGALADDAQSACEEYKSPIQTGSGEEQIV